MSVQRRLNRANKVKAGGSAAGGPRGKRYMWNRALLAHWNNEPLPSDATADEMQMFAELKRIYADLVGQLP